MHPADLRATDALELDERGFCVIPASVSAAMIEQVSSAYDSIVASANAEDVHTCSTTPCVNDFVNRRDEFDSLYTCLPLLQACTHVIGGELNARPDAAAAHYPVSRWIPRASAVGALLALSSAACATGRNYIDPVGPRHTAAATAAAPPRSGDTITVVSYNVEYSRNIDGAIAALTTDSVLKRADIVFLQEMTEEATSQIARGLGMSYAYHPAIFHYRAKRDVGNAVLSRWALTDISKLILPHRSWYGGSQRIATAATVVAGTMSIRVYSTHLGTIADISRASRRDQLATIMKDAQASSLAIIGGDMNGAHFAETSESNGFTWLTAAIPRTTRFGRWDHFFSRGLGVPAHAAGVVAVADGVSDHKPVWARLVLP